MSSFFPRVGLLVPLVSWLVACGSGVTASSGQVGTVGGSSAAGQAGAGGLDGGAPNGSLAGTSNGNTGGAPTGGGSGEGVAGSAAGSAAASDAGSAGAGGADGTVGGFGGATGVGGDSGGNGGPGGNAAILPVCPHCQPIFDGTTLSGWVQVPPSSWSVVNGAMHSLGSARGFIYTNKIYGDFRFIFSSRLVSDPANHLPCVLFWGNSPAKDALSAIQVQPPNGYMWDYRTTGPTANKSPDMFEKRFGHPPLTDTQWSRCEMLGNEAAGKLRFACCQLNGAATCKAAEVVDFTDPSAGMMAPLALQVHNSRMIEEFKDLYVESPVSDPNTLLTTQ